MNWKSSHRRSTPTRGEVLRTVIATADARRDGIVPMDVPGATDVFADQLDVVGALQLRWITRLSGRIEQSLMSEPMDLEYAVVTAWAGLASDMPGVRAIIDQQRAEPRDAATARAMTVSTAKERAMLAILAGRSSAADDVAARVGETIERRARAAVAQPRTPVAA